MDSFDERLQELLDDLSVFDNWTEKYEYIIDLGRALPPMPEQYRRDENLIKGCQSRVWVGVEMEQGLVMVHADSDSLITKGLIAIFIRLLSGLTPQQVAQADLSPLHESGLREHLASTRANALNTMEATIRAAAAQLA